ncbi:AI-2E family transporter, partial [Lactobacillus sp. XV13L]|nr:AI-2E family transporter [Lactobacillus sp. XV13L]
MLEAQVIIATVNTVLTAIVLTILRFPSIPSLAMMVFFLSMIPVAGVIVSLIPLSIIGYTVGGLQTMIYVWIAIFAIHALETYVLNPKLMSSRTHLPIFVTFVVLLVSEQLLGTWGLIVGIPIFTFFLDVLGVQTIK